MRLPWVSIQSSDNYVGGPAAFLGNVISANASDGIYIHVGTDNLVMANKIGTDYTGKKPLGNFGYGVKVDSSNNNISGAAGVPGNGISANGHGGVWIRGNSKGIVFDRIGTDITGNAVDGLGNQGDGVRVDGGTNNTIGCYAIYNNGGLGINLVNGGNHNLAAPVFSVSAPNQAGQALLTGWLRDLPYTTYTLEFYAGPDSGPSGLTWINAGGNVKTDAQGIANFSYSFNVKGPPDVTGSFITGIAIDVSSTTRRGDTSAFFVPVPVPVPPCPPPGSSFGPPVALAVETTLISGASPSTGALTAANSVVPRRATSAHRGPTPDEVDRVFQYLGPAVVGLAPEAVPLHTRLLAPVWNDRLGGELFGLADILPIAS